MASLLESASRGVRMRICSELLVVIVCVGSALGQTVARPPLMNAPQVMDCKVADEWATPAEKSCYATTPDYAATMAYVERVRGAAPGQVKVETFGKTGEGRELDIVIASRDGVFDPA